MNSENTTSRIKSSTPTAAVSFDGRGPAVDEEEARDPMQTPTFDLEWKAHFASLKKRDEIVDLEWRDVEFSIGKREILCGVSGEASSGELVAILGPSGSGKTTLLNILAGRLTGRGRGKKLSGTLRVNGEVVSPNDFRHRAAYVVQNDALFPTSTAREAMEFSANLRLPRSFTRRERAELVNDMIESLGLKAVENTMVGGELIRGLSGGERKRVAIGVELVSLPSILFLDEATSGLDAYSAWKVLKILRAIGQAKTTIMCSIHQPSSEAFREFTSLILLCKGNVVYQGTTDEVDEVFRAKGLGVPPRSNVADHIIFLAQTLPLERLPLDNGNERRRRSTTRTNNGGVDGDRGSNNNRLQRRKSGDRAGLPSQIYHLTVREARGFLRDRPNLIARVAVVVILTLLNAVIFLGAGDQSKEGYTTGSHFGALVMLTISSMFNNAQPSILTFPLERVVFVRERGTDTYGTVPYYLSKLFVEIPTTFLLVILAMLIAYWAIHLGGNFFYVALSLFLLAEASISIALLVGSVASSPKQAMQMAPLVFVPQILFMGFFIRISQIPVWLQWVQYVVSTKYSLDLSVLTVFNPASASTPAVAASWKELLDANDIRLSMAWLYVLILVAIFVGFRVISMVVLTTRAVTFD